MVFSVVHLKLRVHVYFRICHAVFHRIELLNRRVVKERSGRTAICTKFEGDGYMFLEVEHASRGELSCRQRGGEGDVTLEQVTWVRWARIVCWFCEGQKALYPRTEFEL